MKKIPLLLISISPLPVFAHAKWFAEYNLYSPPREITGVLTNSQFAMIFAATALIMFIVSYVDREVLDSNPRVDNFLSKLSDTSEPYLALVVRIGMAIYLLSLAIIGGTILTPELTTDWQWISWVHVVLASTLISRKTSFVCGAGIMSLFGLAIYQYGVFHVMDYPVYLGIATYLIINSLCSDQKHELAMGILRVTTASSLLWAAVEKWAFPEWSFQILTEKPQLTFGLSSELYMILAGFVEFCAAFLLITGRVSARAAASLLLLVCISAIPVFGLIDAIGHCGIIAVLIILLLSKNPLAKSFEILKDHKATAVLHTCWYTVAVLGYTVVYYSGYHLQYLDTLEYRMSKTVQLND